MARRSFDIGRKQSAPKAAAKRRRRKAAPVKKESTHPRLATRAPKRKLRDRRRDEMVRNLVLIAAAVALVVGAIIYLFWLPTVRINEVHASGFGDPTSLESIAQKELKGTYAGVLPRNSFFFYPEREIRAAILERYPGISAISISRSGFSSITLKGSERAAAFLWCGAPSSLAADDKTCYQADAEGLVFASATFQEGTSTMSDLIHVYANLAEASSTDSYPLKARVQGASSLPDILRFARAMKALSVPVASIAIRGDEADLFVPPSTRITYVVGHETTAAAAAQAAFSGINLVDGSLEYVDLRFEGKVYIKRRGE